MTQRASESRDMAARLQRELSQATKRESELTKQLQAVVLKLKRTERLLIKPGHLMFHFTVLRLRLANVFLPLLILLLPYAPTER